MDPSSKKRKLAQGGTSTENAHLSKEEIEARILRCHHEKLSRMLVSSVRKATPAELHVIQSLLAPLLNDAATELHCVRCHENYTEAGNHDSACNIEHEDWDSEEIYGHGYMFTFVCCGLEVESGSDCVPDSNCFTGPHTTHSEEVKAEKARDRNSNFQTCEENGCQLDAKENSQSDGSNPSE